MLDLPPAGLALLPQLLFSHASYVIFPHKRAEDVHVAPDLFAVITLELLQLHSVSARRKHCSDWRADPTRCCSACGIGECRQCPCELTDSACLVLNMHACAPNNMQPHHTKYPM